MAGMAEVPVAGTMVLLEEVEDQVILILVNYLMPLRLVMKQMDLVWLR